MKLARIVGTCVLALGAGCLGQGDQGDAADALPSARPARVASARAEPAPPTPPEDSNPSESDGAPSKPAVVERAGEAPRFPAIEAAVEATLPATIEIRRDIHAHPELGERETRTAGLVAERLRELGYEVREGIAKTGVVGVIEGSQPGGVVAWRADMDALPITEATGLPFASKVTDEWDGQKAGVMHACGHDVHTAVALGLAAVLAEPTVRKDIKGRVVFLFQPAEEGVPEPGAHGAELMVKEGVLNGPKPDAVLGLHVDSRMHVGDVGLVPRGALAATDRFEVDILGQQAHGAYPQDSIDPIVIASQIVMGLQTVASRTVDTRETVVVTVGKIEAGNRYNIIPANARLVGTIRTHDQDVQKLVHDRVRAIVVGIAESMGAKAQVRIDKQTPVTYNDPDLMAAMRPVFERVVGAQHVLDELPHMGGEDFAFYAERVPGLFYFVGVRNPARGIVGKGHTPEFAVDEGSIGVGLRTGANLILTYLDDLAASKAG